MSTTGSVADGLTDVRTVLLEVLDRGFDRKSWHGPNLTGAIRGLGAADAARRPAPKRKCAWEQVLHAAYWKHRVLTKIEEPTRFPRKGSNWPELPEQPTEAAWRADVALLREIHRRLRAAIVALPAERLDAEMIFRIEGAAAHDVYHAGQIKLLRRLVARR